MRNGVQPLAAILESLDMSLDPVACPGLVRVDDQTNTADRYAQAPLEEIVALERAREFAADYVYFRRFVERPPMPVAYIYDWTERIPHSDNGDELATLHRRWWSASETPLVFVFLPTQVLIFHVLQGPDARDSHVRACPLKTVTLAQDVAAALQSLKAYSARRLDDGTFWEQDTESRTLSADGAAFMALSQELGRCRARLVLDHHLDDGLVRRLLILFVMIKYLEERTDRDGNGVFPRGTFSRYAPGAESFVDLLRAGGRATLAFLDDLASRDRFNGSVFKLDESQRAELANADLQRFAEFLDARIQGSQYTFWRRYEFRELPVELISHIYEQFLPKQPGVVYTPPFLVNFILDQVLPLSERTPETFKILDPSCGSGVFLVGAFKRLVHRWRRDNAFRRPDVATLKALLRNHIFGVDIEPEAIRLTVFSLSVALCDFLDPRVIWADLHFDALEGDNLQVADFFEYSRDTQTPPIFDIIVGNPPFLSSLSAAGMAAVKATRDREPGFSLPDNQIALLFLKESTRIARPGGEIALIQPSLPLLYGEKAIRFRAPFLRHTHVSQIVDLTHLSRVLFKRSPIPAITRKRAHNARNPGDVAVAVIFATNSPPEACDLLHVTVRRTVQAEQKLLLEIDHYDLHLVRRSDAENDARVWKANFIGGGRILAFLRRLERMPTLGAYLAKMKRERGWDFGEGYIAGSPKKTTRLSTLENKPRRTQVEESERRKLRKRHRQAPWLARKRVLPTKVFKSSGVDWTKTELIQQQWFAEPRRASLFRAPLLLIKCLIEEGTQQIPVALLGKDVCFKDRVYGIHAPTKDKARLANLHKALLDQRLTRFHVLSTSSEYLVNRSSAFHSIDILNLPFEPAAPNLRLSDVEDALVEDALDHVAQFKREGDQAAVLGEPSANELHDFGAFFCRSLGAMYSTLRAGKALRFASVVCYPFHFGSKPSVQLSDDDRGVAALDALMTTTVGASLRCQRIVRMFHGNMILLIKPAQRRYWLRSIALRDSDDVFADLQERGL